ncbi:hypothetical protein KC318_g7294 [Hortaea werneckii]|nr:hypothetical protein KC334_g7790 [Hortaea werneckii]KAI6953892.1 hypothetical protein KC355_g13671 [Hortaea werneckii]KAI7665140.1 hypothetical protein KC318_g7294 [Hortaea werneckii]
MRTGHTQKLGPQGFSLLHPVGNDSFKFTSDLKGCDMTNAFVKTLGHSRIFATKFFEQHLGMYEINHVITGAVQHHDPVTTNAISEPAKLSGIFVVESSGTKLT